MFELNDIEISILRCQICTSRWGGVRYKPIAFKQEGDQDQTQNRFQIVNHIPPDKNRNRLHKLCNISANKVTKAVYKGF
jgi:hypothetical protein